MKTTTERQNIHSLFTLERTYDALSDKDAMAPWFGGHEGLTVDFRLGGGTVNAATHDTGEMLDALGKSVAR